MEPCTRGLEQRRLGCRSRSGGDAGRPAVPTAPALIHGLWLLVLLRHTVARPLDSALGRRAATVDRPAPGFRSNPEGRESRGAAAEKVPLPNRRPRGLPGPRIRDASAGDGSWPWRTMAVVLWLAGVAAWWPAVGLQVSRFRRLVRAARPAPATLIIAPPGLRPAWGSAMAGCLVWCRPQSRR